MIAEDDVLDTEQAGPAAVRGGILRAGGYVFGALLSLASAALLFRHLGVDDTGRWVTIQSIVLIVAGITDAGLTAIGTREYAVLDGAARTAALRSLFGLRLLLTLVGTLVAIGFTAIAGYGATLVLGTAITCLGLLLTMVQHQYGIGLTARLRLGWVSAADVVRQAVQALAIVLLVVAGAELLDFFWAVTIGCAAGALTILVAARGTIPLRPRWRLGGWRTLLGDTLAYSIATAVGALYFRLAMVLVSLIASPEETGYYSAAFRGVEVLFAIPALVVAAAFPILARAARDDHERLAYAVGKVTDVLVLAGAGLALTLGVGAPVVIQIVAGPDFEPAADVLRVQGIGLFFSFIAAGWSFTALSMRRHRAVLTANLVALAGCAVLVPILASADGALGAAIATTICEAGLAAALGLAVVRGGVRIRVDVRVLARGGAALALALVPAFVPGLSDLVRLVACLAVFTVAVLTLRALPPELLEHLPRRLRPRGGF
jgi:O-antigen/teichoic acid export membrane protein